MKIKPSLPKTKMLQEAKNGKSHNVVVEILIFMGVFSVAIILESLAAFIPQNNYIMGSEEYKELVAEYVSGAITQTELAEGVTAIAKNMPDYLVVVSLFVTVFATIAALVYCRCFEKRKLSTLGFRKDGAVKEYLIGIVVGTGIFSVAVGICLVTGALTFDGICQNISWGMLGLYFLGFLLQGMSEEVIFRGYFTVSLSRRIPIAVAVGISSVGFACAHLGNNGISVLAFINLTLFGVFAAIYMLKRGNIWGACAIHSLWNFVQGNLYGISVSGMEDMESIMKLSSVSTKSLINGGDFGLEGGLAVTIVLVISIAVMLCTKTKQSEVYENVPSNMGEVITAV